MTSKTDVTSQRFIDLLDDDTNPISKLKYKIGDRFVFSKSHIDDRPIKEMFSETPVIEITDIKLNSNGIICYQADIIQPLTSDFSKWEIGDKFLDSHWSFISNIRFINLDSE